MRRQHDGHSARNARSADRRCHHARAAGLLAVVTPLPTQEFTLFSPPTRLPWSEIEQLRPVMPPTWYCDRLADRAPIANALEWAVTKGFVRDEPLRDGCLVLFQTRAGKTEAWWLLDFESDHAHDLTLVTHLKVREGQVAVRAQPHLRSGD